MSEYPGDLVLRAGRRVCRVNRNVEPVYVGYSREPLCLTWLCGLLKSVKGEMAIVQTFSISPPDELWKLPLEALGVEHKQEDMTDAQYFYALETIRRLIAEGLKLVAVDSTDIGNKWTYVSWGLHENYNRYLKPESQRPEIWPLGMPRRQEYQCCPLDSEKGSHRGCFYRCLAFGKGLTREAALFLYDGAIERIEGA